MRELLQVHLADTYKIGKEIGRGGMGVVYRALYIPIQEERAIKVLLLAHNAPQERRDFFLREIRSMDQIRHPRIAPLLESSTMGPITFLATAYYPGGSLAEVSRRRGGMLGADEAVSITLDALDGLAFLHGEGFVHRDIKPSNLLLDADGLVYIGDLGLAKSFELAGLSDFTQSQSSAWGTRNFMPPEQLFNFKYVKPSADVFSMGVTLYWLLTGRLPREGDLRGRAILDTPMIPIRQRLPALSQHLSDVVNKALAKDPVQRFASAVEMRAALMAAFEGG